jgi:drug/metabolite transporter (DMT)-like permease
VGYFFGGESIGPRTVFGTILVLVSVIAISTMPKSVARRAVELAEARAE